MSKAHESSRPIAFVRFNSSRHEIIKGCHPTICQMLTFCGSREYSMIKPIFAAITATVLLASSAVPSSAQYRYRGGYGYGGGWNGGGWNGGSGAALGLGLGLGLLGGALATAPYYGRTLLRSTRLWLRPCSSRTHHLVLVRSIPAILPIRAKLPDCLAASSAMRPG